MYFLETIAGRGGEELASAVLKHLFVHSDTFRRSFVGLLKHKVPISHLPTFRNGIACETEYATGTLADDNCGRIDLYIRADNVALGIENKLWADFTQNQPRKYIDALKDHKVPFRALIIAPGQREEEVRGKIEKQAIGGHCSFISWQVFLAEVLAPVFSDDNKENQVVAGFLREYIETQIGNLAEVDIKKSHLVGDVELGNQYQWDLLYRLRGLFEDAGKMALGHYHIGFYFWMSPDKDRWNWLGFMKVPERGVQLTLETYIPNFAPPAFGCPTKPGPSMKDKTRLYLDFQEGMTEMSQWKDCLMPLIDALKAPATPGGAGCSG